MQLQNIFHTCCSVPTPVDADSGVEALPLDKYIIGALYIQKLLQSTKTNIQMATEGPEVVNEKKKESDETKLNVTERKLHQKCKPVVKENSELDSSSFDKIYWSQKAINSESFEMEETEACKDTCQLNLQCEKDTEKLTYQREKHCSLESKKWTRNQHCAEKNKNPDGCGKESGGLQAKLRTAESKGETCDCDAERNVIDDGFSKLVTQNDEHGNSIVCPKLTAIHKERQDYLELKVEGDAIDGFYKMLYERDRFNDLFQRLEGIGFSVEKDRNGVRKEIHKEFEKINRCLQNRKGILLKELEFMVQQHRNGIAKLRKVLKGKINGLDCAINVALEAKCVSRTAYYNSQQIIENLKYLDQTNNIVEALESRTDLTFQIQPGPVILGLENLGKIELGSEKFLALRTENKSSNDIFGKMTKENCPLRGEQHLASCKVESSEKKQKVDSIMHHDVNELVGVVAQLGNSPLIREKSSLNNQNRLSPSSQDTDVIVEEIFEDDKTITVVQNDSKLLRPVSRRQKKTFHKHVSDTNFSCYAGFQGLVSVSHVINPCHFYVQKSSEKKKAVILAAEADNLSRSMELEKSPATALELGERIIVKSNIFRAWCRGLITELVPSGENEEKSNNPTKYHITDLAAIQVFMLDFGHSEIFVLAGIDSPLKKLEDGLAAYTCISDLNHCVRKLTPQMKGALNRIPPLAIKCSLKDIVPANLSNSWSAEARNEFTRIVDNKAVQMIVLGEDGDKLLVDLKKPPMDKMESDVPVSLRDALVFLELARFVSEYSVPTTNSESNMLPMPYYPPVKPPFLKEIQMMVTHINNPLDFYIQLMDTVDLLILTRNMFELYTGKDVNLEILCPVVGQACAALFDDGGWYRCQISGLPGHREVDVKYVDYGNTARIPVTNIRKLKEDFLTLPIQALQCRLSDVEPTNSTEGWNYCVEERFKQLTLNKCMWCYITCESQGNTLSIHLFESTADLNGTKSCINNMLVEEKLACFTKNDSTDNHVDHSSRALNATTKQINEVGVIDVRDNVINCQQREGMDFPGTGLSRSVFDLGQQVDVKVTFVASPSSIFVQLLMSQHRLKDLQEEMKVVYSSLEQEVVEWEESMDCALLVFEHREWRRGKITKVISDKFVEVFCYDFGNKEMVNICMIRQLKDEFRFGPLALECSLSCIRPAGGSLNWTATACDFLEEILIGSSVLINIEDISSRSPLPVKLYAKDEIGQFVNIAQYLIKKGLALPQKISTAPDDRARRTDLKQNDRQQSLGQATEIGEYSTPNHENHLSSKKIYKSPVLPNVNIFEVEITGVGDDGIIYGMAVSLKEQFTMLSSAIQTSFKVLPFLKPYCYSKREGCIVKGSDTLWYRGRILEVIGGSVKVQYVDRGYTETIPQCHVYPVLMYPDIPELCLPLQLFGVAPVGSKWQEDAIDTLRELLLQRNLEVEIMVPSENCIQAPLVDLHFDGMSVSCFMILHNHAVQDEKTSIIKKFCPDLNNGENVPEEIWDLTYGGLLSSHFETFVLPEYDYPLLPLPGKVFPVTVKHLETPNQVYISIGPRRDVESDSDTDDSGISYEPEDDLEQALRELNQNAEAFALLTDFRSEMPCLAEYSDGRWYRAKVLSIEKVHPLMILVQHVDFGSTASLPDSRLRQIPAHLVQYPARAIKVKLAGFKPPALMNNMDRLVYCPEWSMEALWTMIDIVQGNQLTAFLVSLYPEVSVFLYEEGSLIHLPLVEKGLADLDM
ncbi:RING finger protein 17 [Heterodontus francisci]|uniref:RING finger protein 17 n=1 Tax=Heterodontus francisci TaxID=7792 RepID=UPI00355C302C